MHPTFSPPLASGQVILRSTSRAVTPFGGMVSLFEFFKQLDLAGEFSQRMPFKLSSPNAIAPAHTLMAFICSVIVGASRFAHTDWLRSDQALHTMLGIRRFPGTDTVRNFFYRFNQGAIEAFWRPLWRWLLPHFVMPTAGFSLDLDSTVFQRSGHQQGSKKGYNAQRPGRMSHHPILAVLAEAPCILHGWLRSGNTGTARGVCQFLREAFALLPTGWKLRTVRADSGFFAEELLEFLEDHGLTYIIVAKMTPGVRRKAISITQWDSIDAHYSVGKFTAQLFGWKKQRSFIVLRERIRESKAAVGRKLIDVPGYSFRIFVTNRSEPAMELWRDYNQRALIESRIEELKSELAADGFCMQSFFATEAAFLAVLFSFNLLSLYQKALHPSAPYRQPATLRTTVFLGGAILGKSGRRAVLFLSESWGGLTKHLPLVDQILKWSKPISPPPLSAEILDPGGC